MYTTKQAIEILLKNKAGLTFKMVSNENIHIFRDVYGTICKGEHGDGLIVKLDDELYKLEFWELI